MEPLEVTQLSLDAWNGRDPDAIAAVYAKDGTYSALRTGQVLTGGFLHSG